MPAVQLHRDSVHHMCEVKIKRFDSYHWVWTWRLCLPMSVCAVYMKHESPQPEENTFSKSSVCYCLYLRKSTGRHKALFTLLPDTPTQFAWGGRKIFKTGRNAKHLYVVESYGLRLCATTHFLKKIMYMMNVLSQKCPVTSVRVKYNLQPRTMNLALQQSPFSQSKQVFLFTFMNQQHFGLYSLKNKGSKRELSQWRHRQIILGLEEHWRAF